VNNGTLTQNEEFYPLMIKIKKEGSKADLVKISDPNGVTNNGHLKEFTPVKNILSSLKS
jgi:hypothetical protein